ncbi:MAG: Maf family protein, partial [Sphingomonas sp.]|nr:Maf family protein [Sphingomonas sp.]
MTSFFHRLFHRDAMSLILASNSQIRRAMLEQAGLRFEIRSPEFDEEAAKQEGLKGEQLVRTLAKGKAASLAQGDDAWVIGS